MRQIKSFWSLAIATCLTVILLAGVLPQRGMAHWADLSTGEIIVADSTVTMTLSVPQQQLTRLMELDRQGNPSQTLENLISSRVTIGNDNQPPKQVTTTPLSTMKTSDSAQHFSVQIASTWDNPVQTLTIDYRLFPDDEPGSKMVATVTQGERISQHVFTPKAPKFIFQSQTSRTASVNYGWLGLEHILTGYDHLLFLACLVFGASTIRLALKHFMAFSSAYSLALILTALGIGNIPSVWIESAIAGSVVIMALSGLTKRGTRYLMPATLLFGLVHGVGLASLFKSLKLPQDQLFIPLIQYLGSITFGQGLVFIVLSFVLLGLKRRFQAININALILWGLAVVGSYWVLERLNPAAFHSVNTLFAFTKIL